ncbi:MAG: methionyl-tRNA formyltransferase [Candidatus Uhrbacteria bacterium]|nr:methionyl-tRNA formyltransferase [Candidatus Uhrbacteria bacterium]MDP3793865.1 methionyl-tRNA formyltransferase [Candidatus Uhrbacteria bacterium]
MIRLVFYGTSDFSVPLLECLAKDTRFEVLTVITQPDRPVGRHAISVTSPAKQAANRLGIPVRQFDKIKSDEAFGELKKLSADAAIVASFGQIIPENVLNLYPHGMINVHGSLLPKYRGASPIASAIKNGDETTGITIIKMDAALDHGPTLAFVTEPIRSDDTNATLSSRLSRLSANLLPDILFKYLNGNLKPIEQNHAAATTVTLLSREDGMLDWNQSADELERTVRAFDPWPGTFIMIDGKRLKILRAAVGSKTELLPNTPCIIDGEPAVACGQKTSLILKRVQPEGKTPMEGKEFLRGRPGWVH